MGKHESALIEVEEYFAYRPNHHINILKRPSKVKPLRVVRRNHYLELLEVGRQGVWTH